MSLGKAYGQQVGGELQARLMIEALRKKPHNNQRALIERFDLENGGVVIVAGPEGYRHRGVVNEDAANIGLTRQQIFNRFPGLRVEPQNPIVRH